MTRPFRFGYLAVQAGTTAKDLLEQARFAEGAGFSTFHQCDHFDRSPFSPMLALAACAQVTTTIRLGTLVLAGDFRHPAVLAKEIATLDALSGGRAEIGIGAGWKSEDYEVSGIKRDAAQIRVSRLRDIVRIVTSVLESDDNGATVSTGRFAVTGMRSVPPPVQRPRPPLLIGGGSPRVLTLAGAEADIVGVNMMLAEGRMGPAAMAGAGTEATRQKLDWVKRGAAGRADFPELHLLAHWAQIAEDAREAAGRMVAQSGLALSPQQMLASPHCLLGPKGAIVDRLHQIREQLGFSYVTLYDSVARSFAPVVAELAGV